MGSEDTKQPDWSGQVNHCELARTTLVSPKRANQRDITGLQPWGTAPYMSTRLLKLWKHKVDTRPYILDDMEAVFWVMLLEYVCIAELKSNLRTFVEWPSIADLNSHKTWDVQLSKRYVGYQVQSNDPEYDFYLGPFKELVKTFWEGMQVEKNPQLCCGDIVQLFWESVIREFNAAHPEWDNWDTFFEHVIRPPYHFPAPSSPEPEHL
ncbi:hypothetical protein BDN72DRAFT_894870 [Pluteus cervinus]|uniref:Uncharacterized protein n=1 Tax=Pluteus cervinus TaxID=181527 RepID=A0ACD3B3J2_9AGAR|nr:hypothetical protein BDN72DRAFT_894870 [Pluteus cervinus]